MNKTIVINGKFLLAKLEGMPRVGREISAHLDALLDEEKYKSVKIRMAVPKGGGQAASYKNIEIVETGNFQGPLWEQVDFPVFAGGDYTLNFTATAPITKKRGCVVVHDAQFRSTTKSHTAKSYFLYNLITPAVSKRYRTIITVSDYAKREILDFNVCKRDDIHVVRSGVDHVLRYKVDEMVLDKFGLVRHGYALGNSYVHAHKNVKTLLQAFAEGPPDRQLVLFGSSTRADYDERGIPVPDNVKFLGRISDEDLISLMSLARMFLFPSTTEGFGLPPLEAMLLGCPTICAAAGAMPENCGEGVLYADPHSPADWLEKIDRLWSDDAERHRLSEAGKARAAKFQWAAAAEQYLDLILADI